MNERPPHRADLAIIGAGAAGLFAAVFAGRAARDAGVPLSVVAFDTARKLGAKILVAGGGRCNVTHHAVDETAYAGSTRPAVRKVLGRFGVADTVAFFRDLGVELKREDTGKLFPVTDDANTVLDALLGAVRDAGARLVHPCRVGSIEADAAGGFVVHGERADGPVVAHARRVVLATGGKALPRSGSDGHGLAMAKSLGHSVTDRVFPALVPMTLDPARSFIPSLSGLTVPASVRVHAGSGKKLAEFTNSLLCTHFGISGPAVLDASRYYTDAHNADPAATVRINWMIAAGVPASPEAVDKDLAALGPRSVLKYLTEFMPERLARAVASAAGVDASQPGHTLTREKRRALLTALTDMTLPVTGDRGFTFAEVTAGGVPLAEVRLDTMESRITPGLHLCGEICDVDGRIGGFNFQWAWASGFVAGSAAARAMLDG